LILELLILELLILELLVPKGPGAKAPGKVPVSLLMILKKVFNYLIKLAI
jgi:hypothetical protein